MNQQDNILSGIYRYLKSREDEKKKEPNRLPKGTSLQQGRFVIVKSLGSGGYGNVYLTKLMPQGKMVVLKEFFDKASVRDGLNVVRDLNADNSGRESFLREANILSQLNHPNVVHFVEDSLFEENGTVYFAMDYIKGRTLQEIVDKQGMLSSESVSFYFHKVAEALGYLHDHFIIHYDIKPSNIMIDESSNQPIIIDFGAARQFADKKQIIKVERTILTQDFAPLEQYIFDGGLFYNPSADIYALGVSIAFLLTGCLPPKSPTMLEEGMPELPSTAEENLARACMFAMQPRLKDRPQNVEAFLKCLDGSWAPPVCSANSIPPVMNPSVEAKKEVRTLQVNGVDFNMVLVNGGSFRMGASKEQNGMAYPEELPVHEVSLDDFWMGQTVVTQGLWKAVMNDNPSFYKGDDLPVEMVTYNDCLVFINKLNLLTGLSFRLPTEAEWEYAARGGRYSKGYRYAGSNNLDEVAWFWRNSGKAWVDGEWEQSYLKENGGTTHAVAIKAPNELGLYDMCGNVWEWCSDFFSPYHDEVSHNPQGPARAAKRVFRGGGWNSFARYCRVSHRYDSPLQAKSTSLGLRLVMES